MPRPVERARGYLGQVLEESREHILPSLRVLAHRAGVSRETMRRAAKALADDGMLLVTPGAGIQRRLPGRVDAPSTPTRPRDRWRAVRDSLRRDILRGGYRADGALPTNGALSERIGVNYRTLDKAIQALCQEGLLTRHGNTYRIVTHTVSAARNTVVLIVLGNREGHLRFVHPRALLNFHYLNSECRVRGLQLEVVTVSPSNEVISFLNGNDTVLSGRAGTVLGFILWADFPPRDLLLNVVYTHLASLAQPVAFVDESSDTRPLSSAHRVRFFTPTLGFEAGEAVARMLLSRGHEHVAILHSSLQAGVLQARVEGIRSVYAAAGLAGNVRMAAIAHQDVEEVHRGLSGKITELKRLIEPLGRPDAVGMQSPLWSLHTMVHRHAEDIIRQVRLDARSEALGPMLSSLYRQEETTAWIGTTDAAAITGLEFLQSQDRKHRKAIAVVGFDNSVESMSRGLTTYDFNGRSLAASALNYVLNPGAFHHEPNPMVVPGFVVERRSTR